jgi:lantibiotic modifying enzyme
VIVSAVQGGLSDLNNNGRLVLFLHFLDDSRVVYKPESLHIDAAWASLIEKLNDLSAPESLRTARTLLREGNGWVEYTH